ncbi:MAG: hypothetical protein SF182_08075 [Deltaproteobacteria bacterium]|nr:hypothetical protein [Deltaproteobacteria bacterium]
MKIASRRRELQAIRAVTVLTAWLAGSPALSASEAPQWQLLASADRVVAAGLAFREPEEEPPFELSLKFTNCAPLTGGCPETSFDVSLAVMSKQQLAYLRRLNAKHVITFVSEYGAQRSILLLSGALEEALEPYSSDRAEAIAAEAKRNVEAYDRARAARNQLCPEGNALHEKVVGLIDDLSVSEVAATAAMSQLEALGSAAVPYIVCALDSATKPYPGRVLRVPGAGGTSIGEAEAQYTPQQQVDVLDLVLIRLTGRSFGSIVNGGSTEERARVVRGWWILLGRRLATATPAAE